MVSIRVYCAIVVMFSVWLSGCVGNRAIEAPTEYLSPAGWQDPEAFLTHDSYAAYAAAVTDEVARFRIPFNPEQQALEATLASPVELPLGEACQGKSAGIAILVHGLADTAFSLRDIGLVLAEICYRSRVVLLPGHGTRSGDLLTTRVSDWQKTLNYLIDQAVGESDIVVVGGFSLGGVLTLDAALRRPDDIDGVIGISPAYYLSSERLVKWTPWVAPFMRWVDRGLADDPLRYEAMPTRAVAETWRAMQQMHRSMNQHGPVRMPWMLTHSIDDAVIVPEQNETLWRSQAMHPGSRLVRFVSDSPSGNAGSTDVHQENPDDERELSLPGNSKEGRVLALTHLAIHQSPDNPHYGVRGRYRNCGRGMPRDPAEVTLCEESDEVWYGLWSTEREAGRPMAFSTFNPSFDQLAEQIRQFATQILMTEKRQ